jgi:hypothetical protein
VAAALISYAGASAKTTGGVGAIAGVFVAIAGYFSKQTANPNEKQTVSFFEALKREHPQGRGAGFIIVMFAPPGCPSSIGARTSIWNPANAVRPGARQLLRRHGRALLELGLRDDRHDCGGPCWLHTWPA